MNGVNLRREIEEAIDRAYHEFNMKPAEVRWVLCRILTDMEQSAIVWEYQHRTTSNASKVDSEPTTWATSDI
jgi:hypothetical protein